MKYAIRRRSGVGAHTDYECFTILWQDAPGLQVQNRSGDWIEALPIPGTFVVNIGDMMQRWTNDLFVSTPHRVVNPPSTARYSFPMFFATNHETVVRVLPQCAGPGQPAALSAHPRRLLDGDHARSRVHLPPARARQDSEPGVRLSPACSNRGR